MVAEPSKADHSVRSSSHRPVRFRAVVVSTEAQTFSLLTMGLVRSHVVVLSEEYVVVENAEPKIHFVPVTWGSPWKG